MHRPNALVFVGSALLAQAAVAQRLDFGSGPTTPKPGDGLAVLALADLLDTEAEDIDEPAATRSFRELAATLLRAGENAGPDGSEAVLAALTLAAYRDQLDQLLPRLDHATRNYITEVIAQAQRSVVPREVDLLLRDALAPLTTDADPACGWWPATDYGTQLQVHTAALRALVDNRHLSDQAAATLADMLDLFDSALAEPAYQRDATAWAALLDAASAALDEPPAWLDMPARDQLRADLSLGLAMCLDAPGEARTTLARTATIVRIIDGTDALPGPMQSRELRDAVNRLAGAVEGDAKRNPAAVARIGKTYERALGLINTLPSDPTDLVRQARPMLQPLTASHSKAAGIVVRVLPAVLANPDPMTDPGVLAAMSALASASRDLRLPAELSMTLATWTTDFSRPTRQPGREPLATREMGPLAERVRALGVSLGRDKDHADTLTQLRSLAQLSALLIEIPGESELRSDPQSLAWRRVTGDQADRLLFLVGQTREHWLRSAATDQFADRRAQDRARLLALADLLPLLRDGAAIQAMRFGWARNNQPPLNTWPGWELTSPALDTLAEGLTARLAELSALAARGNNQDDIRTRAVAVREDYAAAILCARLDATARLRAEPACGVAAELGSGAAPASAWMVNHRHALATICRSAFEAAAASDESRATFLDHANRLALPVLDATH